MATEPQTVHDLAAAVRAGHRTAVESVRRCLERIEALDGAINSFREVHHDAALEAARRVDATIADGRDPGPLAGVPVAIKDNIATSTGRTSCGSRMLEEYRSPFTATAVERLTAAGAVVVGKTNCDEFAMGSSTEHCAFGPTRNPWAPDRVPGGSSGGSAAAVAAGLCPAALGSDTGGSVRQPASFCGVVGLKPSYGRVSRWGLVAFGSSLDQVGPVTRTVGDAALLLQACAGLDPRDSTSSDRPVPDLFAGLERPIEGLRIGVPVQYRRDDNDPRVNAVLDEAVARFEDLGARVIEVDLPRTDYGISTYYVIATAEASSNLARYDGIRYGHRAELRDGEELFDLYARSRSEGFGPEVQRRIMLGTYVLSAGYYDAYYKRALRVRRLIKHDFDRALGECHALLGPTAPTPAFRLGEKADPLSMYLCDVYTANTNIVGICAISLPAGFAEEPDGTRLPVGIQLQCRAFDESLLLRVARTFERHCDLGAAAPPLATEPTG
ncbi:MAG: Asp-tRNA(Asn)/Glu-tRNA(Gln) amidotransferase subunit GatA [Planctomycetota bacterium]|jgi:aspartyl-tRNA(Asn)/glutamyl-tRNA(Gln) amidotransferase subunit A